MNVLFKFLIILCWISLVFVKYSRHAVPCKKWKRPIHNFTEKFLTLYGSFENCNSTYIIIEVTDCKNRTMKSTAFTLHYSSNVYMAFISRENDFEDMHTFSSITVSLTSTHRQNCIIKHVAAYNGKYLSSVCCMYNDNDYCVKLNRIEQSATFDLNCFYDQGMCKAPSHNEAMRVCSKTPETKSCIVGGQQPDPLPNRTSGDCGFKKQPKDQTVNVGQTVILECQSACKQQDVSMRWVFKGEIDTPVITDNSFSSSELHVSVSKKNYDHNGTFDLTIKHVGAEHDGLFTCLHMYKKSTSESTARLHVIADARMKLAYTSSSKDIKEKDPVEFTCTAEGGSPPPFFIWKKNNAIITPSKNFVISEKSHREKYRSNRTGHLKLRVGWTDHESVISCSAVNPSTMTISKAATHKLKVLYKPRVSINGTTRVFPGGKLQLYCSVESNTKVKGIIWTKNKVQLHPYHKKPYLTIRKAKINHSGTYTCTAVNEIGNTSGTFTVFVSSREGLITTRASWLFAVAVVTIGIIIPVFISLLICGYLRRHRREDDLQFRRTPESHSRDSTTRTDTRSYLYPSGYSSANSHSSRRIRIIKSRRHGHALSSRRKNDQSSGKTSQASDKIRQASGKTDDASRKTPQASGKTPQAPGKIRQRSTKTAASTPRQSAAKLQGTVNKPNILNKQSDKNCRSSCSKPVPTVRERRLSSDNPQQVSTEQDTATSQYVANSQYQTFNDPTRHNSKLNNEKVKLKEKGSNASIVVKPDNAINTEDLDTKSALSTQTKLSSMTSSKDRPVASPPASLATVTKESTTQTTITNPQSQQFKVKGVKGKPDKH